MPPTAPAPGPQPQPPTGPGRAVDRAVAVRRGVADLARAARAVRLRAADVADVAATRGTTLRPLVTATAARASREAGRLAGRAKDLARPERIPRPGLATVHGRSMEPTLHEGDRLEVGPYGELVISIQYAQKEARHG